MTPPIAFMIVQHLCPAIFLSLTPPPSSHFHSPSPDRAIEVSLRLKWKPWGEQKQSKSVTASERTAQQKTSVFQWDMNQLKSLAFSPPPQKKPDFLLTSLCQIFLSFFLFFNEVFKRKKRRKKKSSELIQRALSAVNLLGQQQRLLAGWGLILSSRQHLRKCD